MGNGSLSLGENDRGVALNTHSHLDSKLQKKWTYSFNPVWAFMVCFRVNFTFTIHTEKSNKMQQYQNLLFHIYMKLNMFRATHRPSSGA
jgi:hypothetical protein